MEGLEPAFDLTDREPSSQWELFCLERCQVGSMHLEPRLQNQAGYWRFRCWFGDILHGVWMISLSAMTSMSSMRFLHICAAFSICVHWWRIHVCQVSAVWWYYYWVHVQGHDITLISTIACVIWWHHRFSWWLWMFRFSTLVVLFTCADDFLDCAPMDEISLVILQCLQMLSDISHGCCNWQLAQTSTTLPCQKILNETVNVGIRNILFRTSEMFRNSAKYGVQEENAANL